MVDRDSKTTTSIPLAKGKIMRAGGEIRWFVDAKGIQRLEQSWFPAQGGGHVEWREVETVYAEGFQNG